jgi:hypothetical protein
MYTVKFLLLLLRGIPLLLTKTMSTCQPVNLQIRARYKILTVNLRQPSSTLSTFAPNEVTDGLLNRLRAGSQWLTAQHLAWLEGSPDAGSDERFSVALAAWTEMERSLRLVFGYEGCVFGPDRRCPDDAPVICDFCMER